MWVGGNWGTFKMGRTLNPSFYGVAAWELTGTANYSVVANTYGYVGGARNSSQFSYKTPDMGGLSAELGYIFKDDNAGAAKWDLNVVYANGPIAAGLSANKAKGQKVGYAIGGKYNFGNFAVAASYSDNHKLRRGFSIGGTATFGAASVTLDLTRDTKHPSRSTPTACWKASTPCPSAPICTPPTCVWTARTTTVWAFATTSDRDAA